MENMKLNQIVFVVIDHAERKVIGAFNDEDVAKQVAFDMEKPTYGGFEITITPVLVDTVNWVTDSRKFYLSDDTMQKALADEIDLAMPCDEDEDEDECDGECDVCCDFDCPSNTSFDPRENDEEYDEEEEEDDDDDEESFNIMCGIIGWMMSSDDEDDGQ